MFDFDAGKLLIIGIVALVFIPSKDLPRVLRQLGQFVTKMRRMASEFQGQFMEAMREADMDELRKEAEKLSEATKATLAFNPISDLKAQVTAALDSKPGLDASEAAALGAASEAAVDQPVPSIAPPDLVARVDSQAHGDSQVHVDAQVHVDPQFTLAPKSTSACRSMPTSRLMARCTASSWRRPAFRR